MTPDGLANLIRARADGPGRFLVALAGPPASGKSTLAETLAASLSPGARPGARVVRWTAFTMTTRC